MSGSIGQKFRQLDLEKGWKALFDKLRSEALSDERKLKTNLAKSPKNYSLNRYINVLPYDHSIVKLSGDVYINANHVNNEDVGRRYILAQGPLFQTTDHFWQMIWEHNTHCVVMLTRIIEQNQIKCHMYFPGTEFGTKSYVGQTSMSCKNGFNIELKEEYHKLNFSKRIFVLKNTKANNEREIVHFQFNTWPDFGVPEKTDDFLEFLTEVRKEDCFNCKYGPVVCHCSAGIGRSGTFVLADTALALAQKTKDPSKIDIKHLILGYRRSRMGLIQTPEQLRFGWKCVVDALEQEKWKHLVSDEESNRLHLKRPTASPSSPIPTDPCFSSVSSAEEESATESPKRPKATPLMSNGCLATSSEVAASMSPVCYTSPADAEESSIVAPSDDVGIIGGGDVDSKKMPISVDLKCDDILENLR